MAALDLRWLEHPLRTGDEVFDRMLRVYGFGKFAAYNVCQLLGHHASFPFDSETVRHFREEHGAPRGLALPAVAALARRHYDRYAPFQFLAYWFELWRGYERRRGGVCSTRWAVRGVIEESADLFDVTEPKVPKARARARSRAKTKAKAKAKPKAAAGGEGGGARGGGEVVADADSPQPGRKCNRKRKRKVASNSEATRAAAKAKVQAGVKTRAALRAQAQAGHTSTSTSSRTVRSPFFIE